MASRTLTVQILGDSRSLERAFSRSSRGARGFQGDMNRTVRGTLAGSGAFRSLGQSIAFASTSFLGAAGFAAGVRKSISLASDLNEEIDKSAILFGSSADAIRSWSEGASTALGITQAEALRAAGNFGAMFETIGLGNRPAAEMSQRLVQLGVDMGSFNNEDPTEMLDRLRAGLSGEAEPLRRFGVLLSEARVQQEAWASGIAAQGKKLTEQQKVQARYNLILRDSAVQQGNFALTSGNLANQQKILGAQISEMATRLGTQLLPFVTDITTRLTEWLGKTENQERVQKTFADTLTATGDVLKTIRDVLGPVVRGVGGLGNAIKILIGVMVVGKVIAFANALGMGGLAGAAVRATTAVKALRTALVTLEVALAIGGFRGLMAAMGAAIGRAKLLRTALLKLRALGPIGIVVTVTFVALKFADEIERLQKQALDAENRSAGKGSLFPTLVPELAKDIRAMKAAGKTADQIITDLRRKLGGHGIADDLIAAAFKVSATPAGLEAKDKIEAAGQLVIGALDETTGKMKRAFGKSATELAQQRNTWFDALVGRRVDRVQDITSLEGQLRELDNIAALIQERIEKTKDITRRLNLEDELLDVRRRQRSIREQIASNRQAHAEEMKALAEQRRQLQIEAREREALARATRQFRALGLGPGGAELVPNVDSLRKTLGRVSEAVKGTMLDTSALRSQLARIRRVLVKGGFGKIAEDVRATIDGMLDDITDKLKDFSEGGPQTKFRKTSANRLLQGLGLDPDEIKALRGRLSQVGVGGTVPTRSLGAFGVPVSATAGMNFSFQVNLDGQPLEATVTRRQRTRRRRNPVQKRGPAVTGG